MARVRGLLIEGGERLIGEVTISGAKNAALPAMAASLLLEGKTVLENVPQVRDIETFKTLLECLGAKVRWVSKGVLEIDASALTDITAPYDLVKAMRASILVLGPLLARAGRARVSLPGGCAIGARPIDLHLRGLEQMGASITLRHGYIYASARKLKGTRIYLDLPTVTGTENLMMAASRAEGVTVIENAAREPEVEDLAELLGKMGVRVEGAGTSVLKIEGVSQLRPAAHRIIPDRIEAGTFMVAAGITRGNLLLRGCRLDQMEAVVEKLRQSGIEIIPQDSGIRVVGPTKIRSADVRTLPYPGFPTDMQAQFMALMTLANGLSVITETIFENRFMHVSELRRMGADIRIEGSSAIVTGVPSLSGAPVMATDLRASASLVLAGLAAEGRTTISRIYHLERGYEALAEKLASVGAKVQRVEIDEGA